MLLIDWIKNCRHYLNIKKNSLYYRNVIRWQNCNIYHEIAFEIVKQITLIILSTNKLNLQLIRVSNYIQRFDLNIRHKSSKQHIILNIFFRFVNDNINSLNHNNNKLNALFIVFLIEIKFNFKQQILNNYNINLN